MKNKILKVSFLNHLNSLKWMFLLAILYYLFVYFLLGSLFSENQSSLYSFLHLYILIQLIIVLYIHFSYYLKNKNSNFRIEGNNIFDVENNKSINSSEIGKIIIHKSYALTAGKMAFFPFQHYKYCEVILKNGDVLIFTSLLNNNIDDFLKENIKGVLFENDFSPFCYFYNKH